QPGRWRTAGGHRPGHGADLLLGRPDARRPTLARRAHAGRNHERLRDGPDILALLATAGRTTPGLESERARRAALVRGADPAGGLRGSGSDARGAWSRRTHRHEAGRPPAVDLSVRGTPTTGSGATVDGPVEGVLLGIRPRPHSFVVAEAVGNEGGPNG